MRHTLKTWPEQYRYIEAGTKTFELRRNDRDFAVGDTLFLMEYDPDLEIYTGKSCQRVVTHILEGSAQLELWGLHKDFVIMSIKEPEADHYSSMTDILRKEIKTNG